MQWAIVDAVLFLALIIVMVASGFMFIDLYRRAKLGNRWLVIPLVVIGTMMVCLAIFFTLVCDHILKGLAF